MIVKLFLAIVLWVSLHFAIFQGTPTGNPLYSFTPSPLAAEAGVSESISEKTFISLLGANNSERALLLKQIKMIKPNRKVYHHGSI